MPWTATKEIVTKSPGLIQVRVVYSDGTRSFQETYKQYGAPNPEWIERTAKDKITKLEEVDAATIDTGPVAEPTPISVDPVLRQFNADMRKLEAIDLLVRTGVVASDNAKVVEVINRIKSNLGTYWEKIR